MATIQTCWALIWAALLASLVPCCSASHHGHGHGHGNSRNISASYDQDIYAAEAEPNIQPGKGEKAEAHGEIEAPEGSEFTSFNVNPNGNEEIAAFITKDVNQTTLEHLFIVLHGKLRDGDRYWRVLDNVIKHARQDNAYGSHREMAVLAPQFFSTTYNSGQYTEDQLAWADLNAWQPGGRATHPKDTTLTSFDVLDGLIARHSNVLMYPNLKNITVVGHGGGGQLVQRYSAVGKDPPSHIHVRYIHGDASSCMYFTKDRPILDETDASKSSCHSYNTWRYGFDEFPGTAGVLKSPEEYFRQYTTRDVVSLLGFKDTAGGGDSSCMANMQGGKNRRARNLVWYRYINTLARTDKDVSGFPGAFSDVPDWSHLVNGTINMRLVVVENAGHDMKELFERDSGRAVLFHDSDLSTGWSSSRKST